MNCDNLISNKNEQDDIFHDLINFLDPNLCNIEEVVVPSLAAEEKLREFSSFSSWNQYQWISGLCGK